MKLDEYFANNTLNADLRRRVSECKNWKETYALANRPDLDANKRERLVIYMLQQELDRDEPRYEAVIRLSGMWFRLHGRRLKNEVLDRHHIKNATRSTHAGE